MRLTLALVVCLLFLRIWDPWPIETLRLKYFDTLFSLKDAKPSDYLAIYDIDDEATTRAVSYGGIAKSDAVGTIQNAETVITMLPAGEHVRSVYLENDNLI